MEKLKVIVSVLRVLYRNVLRAELLKLVEKSDSPIDNLIIDVLDRLLITEEK